MGNKQWIDPMVMMVMVMLMLMLMLVLCFCHCYCYCYCHSCCCRCRSRWCWCCKQSMPAHNHREQMCCNSHVRSHYRRWLFVCQLWLSVIIMGILGTSQAMRNHTMAKQVSLLLHKSANLYRGGIRDSGLNSEMECKLYGGCLQCLQRIIDWCFDGSAINFHEYFGFKMLMAKRCWDLQINEFRWIKLVVNQDEPMKVEKKWTHFIIKIGAIRVDTDE